MDISLIHKVIDSLPYIHLIGEISQSTNSIVCFDISVDTGRGEESLKWAVRIGPMYPFSFNHEDSLHFYNKDLIEYSHIMEEGMLCLHTDKYNDAEIQFRTDLISLKGWVDKYYVHKEKDTHYDYPVINYVNNGNETYTFLYTQADRIIECGDYGKFYFHNILDGQKGKMVSHSLTITSFVSERHFHATPAKCQWSDFYCLGKNPFGIYNMLSELPVKYGKFIIDDYEELGDLMTQDQLNFTYRECSTLWERTSIVPCAFGYKIPNGEINWQTVFLTQTDTPFDRFRERTPNRISWNSIFTSGKIKWIRTLDCSYHRFFGRGSFPESFCNKKILIWGVGAIGSIVATTLTRGGAKSIDLYDIDEKLPENVCRSEYIFFNGIGDKVMELSGILKSISPFVSCRCLSDVFDYGIKYSSMNKDVCANVKKELNQYDLIFDCTTDDQLMCLLDDLCISPKIINLSISNKANELVCAFSPKIKECVSFIYNKLTTPSEPKDLYYPTGCWHSTFKASYNDINIKVSYAMKHIVDMLSEKESISNFWISDDNDGLKLHRL